MPSVSTSDKQFSTNGAAGSRCTRHGIGAKTSATSHLAPTVNQTGQESGLKCAEISKFWSFLQSKSVKNNVWKTIQTPYRAIAREPKIPWTMAPKWKFLVLYGSRSQHPRMLSSKIQMRHTSHVTILSDNKKSANFCMSHDRFYRPMLSADIVGDKFSSRTWF